MITEGIILAAGLSSRFPRYKLTEMINGKTIIASTVENMLDYVDYVYVVTGFNHDVIEEIMKKYPKVTCVYNPKYNEGMFSSVLTGVKAIRGNRFFITPGDCPHIKSSTYQQLLETKGDVIIPSIDYKAGHPILLDGVLKNKLLETKAIHLRGFLKDYQKTYLVVEDTGILLDVDTENDLETLKRRLDHENHGSC